MKNERFLQVLMCFLSRQGYRCAQCETDGACPPGTMVSGAAYYSRNIQAEFITMRQVLDSCSGVRQREVSGYV